MPKKFINKPKANKGYKPRRKYGRRKPISLTNRALHPIPQRFITKMKYSEVVTTTATFGQYAMNLNSIYDPNRTGTQAHTHRHTNTQTQTQTHKHTETHT